MFNMKENIPLSAYSAPQCELAESVLLCSVLADSPEGNLQDFDYVDLF